MASGEAASILRGEDGGWERDAAAGMDPPRDPGEADQTRRDYVYAGSQLIAVIAK